MTETQDERPESIVSNDWGSTRESVLRRDGRCCQFCGIGESAHKDRHGSSLDVHHIVPRERYGSDSLDNLITVCARCHKTAEKISKRAFETIDKRRKRELQQRSRSQRVARSFTNLQKLNQNQDEIDPRLERAFSLLSDWIDSSEDERGPDVSWKEDNSNTVQ